MTEVPKTFRFWVLVKFKDEPGAGYCKQYINATTNYEAVQMAKALYGRLLMYESANVEPW